MTAQELHDDKVRDVAERYRQQGYEVVVEPQPSAIPGFDRSLRPDLLAKKDRDQIVIEIKSRSALRHSDTVRRMADALAEKPDWRFELVVVEDATLDSEQSVSVETINAQLTSAGVLMQHGQLSSAFVLVWIAVETALRKLARAHGVQIGDESPIRLIRELSFNGLISREDYDFLNQQMQSRNQIVHGFSAPALTAHDIEQLHDLAVRLVDAAKDQPAAA